MAGASRVSQIDELIDLLTQMAGAEPEDTPAVTRLRASAEEFLGVLLGLDPELRAELEQDMEGTMDEDEEGPIRPPV